MNWLVLVGVFAVGTVALAEYSANRELGLLYLFAFPGSVRLVAALLLYDTWIYWWHRLNHRIPLLWRFHRMHHSDPAMDVSTATRFHPGEIFLSAAFRLPLIPVIGMPVAALLLYDGIQLGITQLHHANIGLSAKLDRRLRYVLVSPNMHKVHHSQQRYETDSNYSSVLSVWDRIFGTYRERPEYHTIRFGLPDFQDPEAQSVRGLLATPLARR